MGEPDSVARPLITLTTDFGSGEAYVAAVKGVILSVNPAATIVDISHEVQAQNVRQGAFLLHTSTPFFPERSIHVAVVDPGVGTGRRALLVDAGRSFFVAPDNGILSFVLSETQYHAYELTNPSYWRNPVSSTFHGRDIFAPAAAHLSRGVPPEELGTLVEEISLFPFPRPAIKGDKVEGEVLYVDHFGNLVTNIQAGDLPAGTLITSIKRDRIKGLSRTYADAEGLLALIGSSGYLEVSLRNGSAADRLQAREGAPVVVSGS